MTRSDLCQRIGATHRHLLPSEIRRGVDKLFGEISAALCRGDKVELRGFGRFGVKRRGPRQGRNPKTGAAVQIDATYYPSFKMGSRVFALLNRKHPSRLTNVTVLEAE